VRINIDQQIADGGSGISVSVPWPNPSRPADAQILGVDPANPDDLPRHSTVLLENCGEADEAHTQSLL